MVKPLVSVCLITYNHAAYIEQAIDSVLMQKVNFPWEFIIADDFSTDGTRDILIKYQEKHPDLIRLILQDTHVGAYQNWLDLTEKSPRGKYVAYFEGDDYWVDAEKLQIQADFLEANPDFSVCFHRVYELNGKELTLVGVNDVLDKEWTILDLAKGNIISTLSIMYRYYPDKKLPDWFSECPIGDYPLHLINGTFGKYKFLSRPMAVYRRHSGGSHSMKSFDQQLLMLIRTINAMKEHFPDAVRENLMRQRDNYYEQLIRLALTNQELDKAISYAQQATQDNYSFHERLSTEIFPEILGNLYRSRKYRIGNAVVKMARKIIPASKK